MSTVNTSSTSTGHVLDAIRFPLWAFACGSTRKVCAVIGGGTALLVAAAWLLSGGQA